MGKCTEKEYVINVMMMLNEANFSSISDNIKPAVDIGIKRVQANLKGKSTTPW